MKEKKSITAYTVKGAAVAALYVILTVLSAMMGLSSGVIQLRLSEALCILPVFMPEAVPGLFIGCLISNLLAGGVIWDVIFGSIATLLGAIGAYMLRKLPSRIMWLATLPTVAANVIIVPPVLIFAYGVPDAWWFIAITVGIGELICATVGGYAVYRLIKKYRIRL